MDSSFLDYSPLFIIVLSLFVLIGLLYLGKQENSWECYSLALIPMAIFTIYLYIFLKEPNFEQSKVILRSLIIFSLFDGSFVVYSKIDIKKVIKYIPFIMRGGKY